MEPLVVIVGATGVGKSRLGIALAKALHKPPGQVISADSMQVYKGLDIASAKVTPEEAQGVVHHLTSFVELTQVFQVHDFLDVALPTISAAHTAGDLPIVVGGTFFYVEALLWDNFMAQQHDQLGEKDEKVCTKFHSPSATTSAIATAATAITTSSPTPTPTCTPTTPISLDAATPAPTPAAPSTPNASPASPAPDYCSPRKRQSHASPASPFTPQTPSKHVESAAAWEELQQVDPDMARRLHPHDIRKIRRSLEVFHTTGKRHSEWLEMTGGALGVTAQLRYKCVIIWLDCEQQVLDQRIDKRVEEMLSRGLVTEVEDYYLRWKQQLPQEEPPIGTVGNSSWVDGPTGVCQAIGYKEFLPYLKMKFDEKGPEDQVASCLTECVQTLKLATRRYSRKQRRWILKRFEGRGITVHRLDTTDASSWERTVLEPATAACRALQSAEAVPLLSHKRRAEPRLSEWQKYSCVECDKTLNGAHEWQVHVGSKKHKKRVASAPLRKLVDTLNRRTQEGGLFSDKNSQDWEENS